MLWKAEIGDRQPMIKLTVTLQPDVRKAIVYSDPNLPNRVGFSLPRFLQFAREQNLEYKLECYIPISCQPHRRAFREPSRRRWSPYELAMGFDN
jgi:hypothetical protein